MKTIQDSKGRIVRLWIENEQIDDELDRTFEVTSNVIYQFEDAYPIPDRSSVMALYCQPQEGSAIQVAAVTQLSTMRRGELIWGKDKTQFQVIGSDGTIENKGSLFIFLPLAETEEGQVPGEYMSADPTLPICENDAYDFARNFTSFFNSKATLQSVNTIMADLMVWMVQMYKIAELNQDNCAFAEMMYRQTADNPQYSNVVGIANEMRTTPFTAEEVNDFLLDDLGLSDEDVDSEQSP